LLSFAQIEELISIISGFADAIIPTTVNGNFG
jgi:hypothetical protein